MGTLARLTAVCLSLGLMLACNREDLNPQSGAPSGETGSARLFLPPLPAHYLGKIAPGAKANFALTVSVGGKVILRYSRTLIPGDTAGMTLTGIPSGPGRVFRGQLLRNDSVTHEGVDSVTIYAGRTADVHLHLADIGPGSAHVCVQIEGEPLPYGCRPPVDTVVHPPVDTVGPPRDSLPPDTGSVPPIDTVTTPVDSSGQADSTVCWNVSQLLNRGGLTTGTLTLRYLGARLEGSFHWNGYSWFPVSGTLTRSGETRVYLSGRFPAGMSADGDSIVHYRGGTRLDPKSLHGTVYGVHNERTNAEIRRGTWKAVRVGCVYSEPI